MIVEMARALNPCQSKMIILYENYCIVIPTYICANENDFLFKFHRTCYAPSFIHTSITPKCASQWTLSKETFYERKIRLITTWWRHQMETFSALLAVCAGNSPVTGGALRLSLICAWINGWVHNREAGNLRSHRAHYDVIVMQNVQVKMMKVYIELFRERPHIDCIRA